MTADSTLKRNSRSRLLPFLYTTLTVVSLGAGGAWGQDEPRLVNPPISDVSAMFEYQLPHNVPSQGEFDMSGFNPHKGSWDKDHYQGIIRHKNALFLTGSQPNEPGQLTIVELCEPDWGNLETENSLLETLLDSFTSVFKALPAIPIPVESILFDEYWHLGGMDLSGDILAVAAENDQDGAVFLYDVSSPLDPVLVKKLSFSHKVGAVGITRQENGKMLLALTFGSYTNVFLYQSESPVNNLWDLSEMKTVFKHSVTPKTALPQAVSLLTQDDGSIFLMGTYNTHHVSPLGANEVYLCHLDQPLPDIFSFDDAVNTPHLGGYPMWALFGFIMGTIEPGEFIPTNVQTHKIDLWEGAFWPGEDWKHPNFVAGGGMLVTEDGELELWAAPHVARNGGQLRYSTTYMGW